MMTESHLETAFLYYWHILATDLPEPAPEFKPIKGRRFRLDFAFPAAKVGIELHGATFTGGRHTRGPGFQADREKMNLCVEAGWVILEYTHSDIHDRPAKTIEQIKRVLNSRNVHMYKELENEPGS